MSKEKDDAKKKFDTAAGGNRGIDPVFPDNADYDFPGTRNYFILFFIIVFVVLCFFGGLYFLFNLIGH